MDIVMRNHNSKSYQDMDNSKMLDWDQLLPVLLTFIHYQQLSTQTQSREDQRIMSKAWEISPYFVSLAATLPQVYYTENINPDFSKISDRTQTQLRALFLEHAETLGEFVDFSKQMDHKKNQQRTSASPVSSDGGMTSVEDRRSPSSEDSSHSSVSTPDMKVTLRRIKRGGKTTGSEEIDASQDIPTQEGPK